jgi:hypothetical protein
METELCRIFLLSYLMSCHISRLSRQRQALRVNINSYLVTRTNEYSSSSKIIQLFIKEMYMKRLANGGRWSCLFIFFRMTFSPIFFPLCIWRKIQNIKVMMNIHFVLVAIRRLVEVIGPSGVRALPLAAVINIGGHYKGHFFSSLLFLSSTLLILPEGVVVGF